MKVSTSTNLPTLTPSLLDVHSLHMAYEFRRLLIEKLPPFHLALHQCGVNIKLCSESHISRI